MTGVIPSSMALRMRGSWLEPDSERSAKMRRARTPLAPTSWMRVAHMLAGALIPMTLEVTGPVGGKEVVVGGTTGGSTTVGGVVAAVVVVTRSTGRVALAPSDELKRSAARAEVSM